MQQPRQYSQWMATPQQKPQGCPPGLEYMAQIDQLLVHQQVELLEGRYVLRPTNISKGNVPICM